MTGMESINSHQELEQAPPETLRFHSTFKAIARMMIRYLPFANVDEEAYAARLTGNAKVLYGIIKEWQKFDERTHRKDMLTKPLLVGLFTYFFDSDFREVFDFMLNRVIQNQANLFFPPHHLDPACWDTNDGKRGFSGTHIPPGSIIRQDNEKVVLNGLLHPRLYWLKIGEVYYATNTSKPVFVGDGWAYQLIVTWGSDDEFKKNACLGDIYVKN